MNRTQFPKTTVRDWFVVLFALLALGLVAGLVGCAVDALGTLDEPAPIAAPTPSAPLVTSTAHPVVVWLDFHDGTPTPIADDGCFGRVPQLPVECDLDCRGEVLVGLEAGFGDLAVTFTTAHPITEDYLAMIIVGGTSESCTGLQLGGEAPLACSPISRGSGYVFQGYVGGPNDGVKLASAVAHELGHMLGLNHSADDHDFMTQGPVGIHFSNSATPDGQPACDGSMFQDEPALLAARVGYR